MKTHLVLFLTMLISSLTVKADNEKDTFLFRKVDYQQGLSNSAVLSLFQDNEGLMWFGTYDGVNCWDGKTMEVFRSDFSEQKTLSNNVIHSIQQADSSCLWITTHLGANRFSKDSRQVISNYEFKGDFVIHSNQVGNTWVLGYDWIAYYNTYHHRFVQIQVPAIKMLRVDVRAFVTDEGELYLFPYESGDLYRFSLSTFDTDTLSTRLTVVPSHFHSKPIQHVCYQNGVFCFYDSDYDLFVYDISRKSKIYIRNIAEIVQKYGKITGIVPFYEDIIIAFQTNGLIRLRLSQKYAEEIIDRNIRVYGIYNDSRQGVLWIGTDGHGAMMYSKKYSIATNLMLNDLSPNLSRQIRSIMTDKYGGLWFGTKGDGLLHVKSYRDGVQAANAEAYSLDGKQSVLSYLKPNQELQVYTMLESSYMNGFWVGTGVSGLCYYSFDDGKLHEFSSKSAGSARELAEVHSIFEENDSVLYVAASGEGFSKILIDRSKREMQIKSRKNYRFFYEQQELNLFYSMVAQGDSLLWLGSRQRGLVRFNRKTEEYQIFSLNEMLHKSVDDILCLHWHGEQLYVGTTSGLVCITFEEHRLKAKYIGREQGLLNDMIHSILEDDNGLLWLGTNRGLIKFNPKNLFSHAYYYSGGVQIGEFSDDAYYHCPYTGSLFFGGIDGLLYLDKKVATAPEYYPEILLRKLVIEKTFVNLQDHYLPDRKGLQMKGAKLSFSLFFVVPDYAGGGDVEYSYMLEGYDKDWGAFSSANDASYFNVPSGDYLFKVRYKKDVFATEYKTYTIPIHILPPWYQTVYAYLIYIVLGIVLVIYVVYLFHKYFRHERMMKKLLESENRNVSLAADNYQAREVLNTCTLIYQACDQLNTKNISSEEHTDKVGQIREYVMSLLFGCGLGDECFRMLSSLHFSVSARLSLFKLAEEVLQVLEKEGNNVSSIRLDIPENFTFPAYKNALRCILYFSYLYISGCKSGEVSLMAAEQGNRMMLTFTSPDDVVKRLYEMLSGEELSIKAKDSDDMFRIRTIQRFVLSALKQQNSTLSLLEDAEQGNRLTILIDPVIIAEQSEVKKTVLLLEDREEMVWLISALLSGEYEVRPVRSVQLAFDEMHKAAPTLFLVDMLMYADAESTFIKYVNKNRSILSKTAFIPMLTWKVSAAMQKELILWADSYIVLPYDIPFLTETIHKVIYGKQEAKQIYMEELEGWADSIVCTTVEQADFVRKFLRVVEQNLDREDMGSTFVAEQMLMSPRQFYRKFKEISGMSPSDLIRDYRMEKAASLLHTEDLSIQEVISEVGISSRAYFYKEFTRRFGMTPKAYREQMQNSEE